MELGRLSTGHANESGRVSAELRCDTGISPGGFFKDSLKRKKAAAKELQVRNVTRVRRGPRGPWEEGSGGRAQCGGEREADTAELARSGERRWVAGC